MATDWHPVPGDRPVTVLVPVVLYDVTVCKSKPHLVRGREMHGQFSLLPLEWVRVEDRERLLEALKNQ